MRSDLIAMTEALHRALPYLLIYRKQITYGRTPDGGFAPSTVELHTWVWHRLTVAAEKWWEWRNPSPDQGDSNLLDLENLPDGRIGPYERAFRLVREQNDDPEFHYSLGKEGWVPLKVAIPTCIFKEVYEAALIYQKEYNELDKYRLENWDVEPK